MKDLSTVGGALLKFGGLIFKVFLTVARLSLKGFGSEDRPGPGVWVGAARWSQCPVFGAG